jgi:Domain of unknown function (DUF4105)
MSARSSGVSGGLLRPYVDLFWCETSEPGLGGTEAVRPGRARASSGQASPIQLFAVVQLEEKISIGANLVTNILRAVYIWIYLLALALPAAAQNASNQNLSAELPQLSNSATASLVTYTPGEELYQAFGHSAIRIRDDSLEMDRLYNYGTFDFETPNFYLKFAHGDLLYQLSVTSAEEEIRLVSAYGQGVTELVLSLSQDQKQELFEALEYNLLPENRFYRYDFILDNCSTRPRDVLERVILTPIAEKNAGRETFRQMLDSYFARVPWTGFGLSLLLGANVDRIANAREACFLPLDLERAVENSQNGRGKLTLEKREISPPGMLPHTGPWLSPSVVFVGAGLSWFFWWLLRKQGHASWPTAILFTLFGATGLFLLGFSLWSRLAVVQRNYNLAWLIPTHLLAGFWLFFSKSRPLLVRWYFWFSAIEGSAFVGLSFLLPQGFHPAVYPLVVILVWRSVLEVTFPRKCLRNRLRVRLARGGIR